jgi:hypothetical protein
MNDNKPIAGELGQCDRPNWNPLLDLLGEQLVCEFMWMSQIDLADGTTVHAYKHILTRHYLHASEDGRTFAFTLSGRYRPTPPYDAMCAAFDDWERLTGDDAEVKTVGEALREALRKALRLPA